MIPWNYKLFKILIILLKKWKKSETEKKSVNEYKRSL